MLEVLIGALSMAALMAIWAARKRAAEIRLARMDAGELCVACGSMEVDSNGATATCLVCGYVSSLDALRSAVVSDAELEHVTKPGDKRLVGKHLPPSQ